MFNYNDLIDHYYYKYYNPVGVIKFIKQISNNYFRIYYKNDNGMESTDVTYDELCDIYNDFLIRADRYNILKDRDINYLVHFTKVDNLENILEYGIFSIDALKALEIDYRESDQYRFDNKGNKISTSITYPNYKMLYKKRMEDRNQDWAIIRIDSELLLHKLNTEFYRTNAANSIYYNDNRLHNTNDDLEDMFYDENRSMYLPKNYTTDPQAEVLVDNSINYDYFTSIETLDNNPKVRSLTRDAHIDYNPESRLFNARSDYARWK